MAQMDIQIGEFIMVPPQHNSPNKAKQLPDIRMFAVYVLEKHPPEGETPVEWMLLTNQKVNSPKAAREKIEWYSLRWRIEMYFKVLKSVLRVEACCLSSSDRLIRYLSVMSIVAWRLFMITLIARTNPSQPCTEFLAEQEWQALVAKFEPKNDPLEKPPNIGVTLFQNNPMPVFV